LKRSRLSGVEVNMPEDPQASKVRSSFERLSKTANSLNTASDRLNKAIDSLNDALKKLNLGVASWVTFSMWQNGPLSEVEEIGYAKWGGKWVITLRKTFDDLNRSGEDTSEETGWAFTEAPREMRLRAIPHLPKLIDKLNEDAEKATTTINEKTGEAEAFASAIIGFVEETSENQASPKRGVGGKK
jgi:prefoldin subunit 5